MAFEDQSEMKIVLSVLALFAALLAYQASGADRTSADALLTGVPDQIKENNFKAVEELCKRSLQEDESCPAAHFYLGVCFEKAGRAREAVKEYQIAAANATKEKDSSMAAKANSAAKKLGSGFVELDAADAKMADKLTKLAADSFDAGQYETAREAFHRLMILQPENPKWKENLEKCTKAIEERGDPIKSKIAAAALSEIWFRLGIGEKNKAKELAQNLSSRFSDTLPGKEAAALIERDFAAPKVEDVAQLTEKLKSDNAAKIAATSKPVTPAVPASVPSTVKPGAGRVDVEAAQRLADEETKKLGKDALIPAFKDAHKKGKEFYAKATPGSEGNQENIARALDQFIKADSLYARIEAEQLSTPELAAEQQEVGMLHYACLKMTILAR